MGGSVALGCDFCVVRGTGGTVWGYGSNRYSQLGLSRESEEEIQVNEVELISFPTEIPVPATITQLSCGYLYTACLDTEGFVWIWGELEETHAAKYSYRPSPFKMPALQEIISIHCGDECLFCIDRFSYVWSFCGNSALYKDCTTRKCDEDLEQTRKHILEKYCIEWIRETEPEFDIDEYMEEMEGMLPMRKYFPGIKDISSRTDTLFLNYDGQVFASGFATNFGFDEETSDRRELCLEELILPPIEQIAMGHKFSLFLTEEGDVYICGDSKNLGYEFYKGCGIQKISLPVKMKNISCGFYHFSMVDTEGNLWLCGLDSLSICKQEFTDVVYCASGGHNTLVVCSDGSVWGLNGAKKTKHGLNLIEPVKSTKLSTEYTEHFDLFPRPQKKSARK